MPHYLSNQPMIQIVRLLSGIYNHSIIHSSVFNRLTKIKTIYTKLVSVCELVLATTTIGIVYIYIVNKEMKR
jgi:hypothetical protein